MKCQYCGEELNVVGICVNTECPDIEVETRTPPPQSSGKAKKRKARRLPEHKLDSTKTASSHSGIVSLCNKAIQEGYRLRISYVDREGHQSRRKISLVEVSDNMLKAYCHQKLAGRNFRVTRIQHAELLDEKVQEADLEKVRDEEYANLQDCDYQQPSPSATSSRPSLPSSSNKSGCLIWIIIIIGWWILI